MFLLAKSRLKPKVLPDNNKVTIMLRKDKSQHAKTVGISLYPELIAAIDEQRGLVPRSNFITYVLQHSPLVFSEKQSKTPLVSAVSRQGPGHLGSSVEVASKETQP
jgi:hypothetical protein